MREGGHGFDLPKGGEPSATSYGGLTISPAKPAKIHGKHRKIEICFDFFLHKISQFLQKTNKNRRGASCRAKKILRIFKGKSRFHRFLEAKKSSKKIAKFFIFEKNVFRSS